MRSRASFGSTEETSNAFISNSWMVVVGLAIGCGRDQRAGLGGAHASDAFRSGDRWRNPADLGTGWNPFAPGASLGVGARQGAVLGSAGRQRWQRMRELPFSRG